MALIRLQNISVSFGGPALFDGADLTLEKGERVCLVGRNGEGKSTLLRVLNGDTAIDDGERILTDGTRVTMLEQAIPEQLHGALTTLLNDHLDANTTLDEWERNQRVSETLSKLALDANAMFEHLSGGLKRRALLARALALEPNILLLDEPTNHLDIDAIEWLEKFLTGYRGTLLFITHDRNFLRKLATRIVEIDRGQLTSWPGDYDTYLRNKQAALDAEEKQNAEFDKKLAREEVWIRQGIKARRTRNEGRVRDLKKMRAERAQRRERIGRVRMSAQQSEKSGKTVIEAKKLKYSIGGNRIVSDFSAVIQRGDKIGILGKNGVGKTTLINLLLGQLAPNSGTVELGANIELAYFDQMRAKLNPEQTAQDNVGGGAEIITINGQSKHIISYLQDFLFSPVRARAPIKALSGGERNRLLLAKLFTKPANLLVMDEPTNDLDIETLELLEEQLLNFPGTLLLVSHDRAFVDNIVTSTLVFEGNSKIGEYVGGYDDYLRQRTDTPSATAKQVEVKKTREKSSAKKLSYKDQRELDQLPSKIENLEDEKSGIETAMNNPAFYQQDAGEILASQKRHSKISDELELLYARWDELESKIA